MVVFTCNHCGESLKKQVVDKHKFRCRKDISVSCMDCFKDFYGDEYNVHNTCITEAQRYSGKDYVPKANQNKGQKKQEAWVDVIRSIGEKNANLSQGVTNVLQTISSYDNIPRKKAKFLNFMKNSFKYFKYNELEEAWDLLEVALKENKPEPKPQNGTTNGNANKRKIEDEVQPEENGTKAKKKKLDDEVKAENGDTQEETAEKFNWTEVIRSILVNKNNEIKLSKLKKKVLNRYKKFSGSEISEKLESKFSKKLKKSKGFVVDNEKVKLIE
ncbi:hypothetical protein ACKWTF_003535 [Chironomus riparius]